MRTGDIVEMNDEGVIRLVDRTKDLVKSGGEWISSVDLENAIMSHPEVAEATVVAAPDSRWGERPCAFVTRTPGSEVTAEELRGFLEQKVARWWIPELIEFVPEVAKTSIGKFDKKALRIRAQELAAAQSAPAGT